MVCRQSFQRVECELNARDTHDLGKIELEASFAPGTVVIPGFAAHEQSPKRYFPDAGENLLSNTAVTPANVDAGPA